MGNTPQASAGFLGKFTVLGGAARELWVTFAVKLLMVAAYALANSTIVLWLSSDFGYSDQDALGMVALWSVLMTVCTVLVGSLTDAIGLRRTFFLGVWICIVARAVMVFVDVEWLALAGGLFPLAVGEALSTPVLIAAVRRYTTTQQRSISFSIFYMMMNVGFLIASFVFDFVRQGLGEHGQLTLPLVGMKISTYRALFLASLGVEISVLPLLYLLRVGVEVTDEGLRVVPVQVKERRGNMVQAMLEVVRDTALESVRLFRKLFQQAGVYRLLAFLILIAFLKLIFMQMYYVYPKFGIRELGNGAPVGRLWAINSILIIFLVPLVGALTQKISAYKMVTLGGIISAASVFIMALPTAWFEPLANGLPGHWLGHGYLGLKGSVHPYYPMIALFVILLSVGEAFYSPRVYEYAAAIAPKGQEASYASLSYVPFLLAKLLIGTFSGMLLARYCPEHGERHSETMWLYVALTATIAPVGLILLRRLIRVQEAGRED
ncbi:MAG TPA: MFS transporter [Candidatus Paceibacterota bacterium]|nr:MFS transporter [Verrucomicrobiota bacterium]HSA11174.1 MFS transporter [Candidatus Paceibacterota bacterium]